MPSLSLPQSNAAWPGAGFEAIFKAEVASLPHEQLPLQQGLSLSSYVSNDKVSAIVLKTTEVTDCLHIKAGLFYTGIIAGCSCADDPTPQDTQTEYCEVLFVLQRQTGHVSINLIND